ncbi:MAG: class I SAM-dependent methyltransferase [Streptomyces sp.]|nr:class I SAM-dependent methyltransferase [Streptomyces sp.]NUR43941.1 class I SAM-dependent methyltransferase [Streptomyces sp.]NUS14629.1 class I SAM-dependent methyltransferase [Streptomyces sp.]NUS25997.1 class I SAM-dependent methyltransferase [Streptomyces sp.]NUS79813.1 class I SAM-dependent methyltransferase [Streptomyces sp.]
MGDHARHDSVRHSYDTVAEEYTTRLHAELEGKPLDRALLTALLEQTEPGAPVGDLGCGPGHVAAWLAEKGARTVGVDLSEGMVEAGRSRFPQVEFRQGDLLELPAEDAEFGSLVALYTVIHLEPAELPRAFEEMARVLRPGGPLLLSFHIGEEVRHLDEWWGHSVDVDFRFLDPAHVAGLLEAAGLTVEMKLERTHYAHEAETRRAYVLARRS